jgi:hypothetical protein
VMSSGRTRLAGYVGLVVLPVVIAVSLGSWRWVEHSDLLSFDRYGRAVEGASYLLIQALGQSQGDFADRAPVVPVTPPYDPAVQRALAGDTVAGLASTDTSLELTVVVADSAGTVRMIRESFHPPLLDVFPTLTNLGLSIYLRGRRSATTDPPLGPVTLAKTTLARIAATGSALRYAEEGARGVFVSVQSRPGSEPELVLLAGEAGVGSTRGRWLLTLLPILVIVLFLAVTAAWTMVRSSSDAALGTSLAQSALVALIPVLAGSAILVAIDRGFQTEVVDSGTRELAGATLLVRQLELPLTPDLVKMATGFGSAIVGPDGLEEATTATNEVIGALSSLKLPPPNWMSSGAVATDLGPAFYEITRVGSDRGLVLFRTDLSDRIASLRNMLVKLSAIMLLPALLFLTLGGLRRPVTENKQTRPPSFDGPSTS